MMWTDEFRPNDWYSWCGTSPSGVQLRLPNSKDAHVASCDSFTAHYASMFDAETAMEQSTIWQLWQKNTVYVRGVYWNIFKQIYSAKFTTYTPLMPTTGAQRHWPASLMKGRNMTWTDTNAALLTLKLPYREDPIIIHSPFYRVRMYKARNIEADYNGKAARNPDNELQLTKLQMLIKETPRRPAIDQAIQKWLISCFQVMFLR